MTALLVLFVAADVWLAALCYSSSASLRRGQDDPEYFTRIRLQPTPDADRIGPLIRAREQVTV